MSTISIPETLDLKDVKTFFKNTLPAKGVLMLKKSSSANNIKLGHAPCSLIPSPVPRKCFHQAIDLQRNFQQLIFNVSCDHAFIKNSLQHVIKVDDFTSNLWSIYDRLHREKLINPLSLTLIRNDYMFHNQSSSSSSSSSFPLFSTPPPCQLKQIEMNTIAASFAGLSQALSAYHKLVVRKFLDTSFMEKVPENTCCDGLAEGLTAAWKAYGNPKAIVVFLVAPDECNIFDQSHLELAIRSKEHGINVHRFCPQEVKVQVRLDAQRKLFIGKHEVAVVYLRTWYSPDSCEGMWQTRWMMESSKTIMVPNVGSQLAGTKKIQQVLTANGCLERFINKKTVAMYPHEDIRGSGLKGASNEQIAKDLIENLKSVFAAQYSMEETEDGEAVIEVALKDPHKFVVKPQREGGGNNYYNQEIPPLLTKIRRSSERSAYIVMDKIEPWVIHNIPIKDDDGGTDDDPAAKRAKYNFKDGADDDLKFVPMVSELGVYGYLLGDGSETTKNVQTGHLLRTKRVGVNEGGVATGFSVLDSPFLLD